MVSSVRDVEFEGPLLRQYAAGNLNRVFNIRHGLETRCKNPRRKAWPRVMTLKSSMEQGRLRREDEEGTQVTPACKGQLGREQRVREMEKSKRGGGTQQGQQRGHERSRWKSVHWQGGLTQKRW